MFRRINLLSGPGVGKSTMAARIYSALKIKGRDIELVREHVKNWVYEERAPKSFDQVFLFGAQMRAEDIVLRSGVEILVTDSPLFLSICYAEAYETPGWRHLLPLCDEFEGAYPSVDIFLERRSPYEPKGRFQDEGKAMKMDDLIRTRLAGRDKPFYVARDEEEITRIIDDAS
jgi:nicotinamide riboside kinase